MLEILTTATMMQFVRTLSVISSVNVKVLSWETGSDVYVSNGLLRLSYILHKIV